MGILRKARMFVYNIKMRLEGVGWTGCLH